MRTRQGSDSPLIFDWPAQNQIHVLLPLAICVSAAIHLGFLFVFRIVHPEPGPGKMLPAAVWVLQEGMESTSKLGAWLSSSDPAHFSAIKADRSLLREVFTVEYTPSFDSEIDPLILPVLETPQPIPQALDPPTAIRLYQTPRSGNARVTDQKERIIVTGEEFRAIHFPVAQGDWPPVGSDSPVDPSWFLLAVAPDGNVRLVFLERTSGNPDLDLFATNAFRKARVDLHGQPTEWTWGRVAVHWTGDIAPEKEQPGLAEP